MSIANRNASKGLRRGPSSGRPSSAKEGDVRFQTFLRLSQTLRESLKESEN